MIRAWPIWLTLLLLAASVGWFWLLSADLTFDRFEASSRPPAALPK